MEARPASPAEPALATPEGRRVFVIGGLLMIVAAVLAPVSLWHLAQGVGSAPGHIGLFLSQLFFAAAVVVFAVGWARRGSVVAGRWVGMIALLGYAVGRVVPPLITWAQTGDLSWDGTVWWPMLIFGLVGVIEIGRIGAVRGAARWLPLVLFVIEAAIQVFQIVVQGAASDPESVPAWAYNVGMVLLLGFGGWFLGPLILGIVALRQASAARVMATGA